MFNIFKKKPPAKKYKLDHDKSGIDQLKILSDRLDTMDRRRKKHEQFVDSVIRMIDPSLLDRDPDNCYKFISDPQAIKGLKEAIEKILVTNK